jgi:hypothetical protein
MSDKKRNKIVTILIIFSILVLTIIVGFGVMRVSIYVIRGAQLQSEAPFMNPPVTISEDDLLGTWQTEYMEWGSDIITINRDGSFKQVYEDKHIEDGKFEYKSPRNSWWIEKLSDGRVYLHLKGGKYYLNGVSFAKRVDTGDSICIDDSPLCANATRLPLYLYDWIGDDFVRVEGELILNIRATQSGEIVLLHLWSSSDKGFPLIGGDSEIFRRTSIQ